MKMKKTIIWMAAVVAALPLQAQKPSEAQKKGDLNREMEVTREYEPTVDAASKLSLKPNMVDTVALRPEVDFSVTARPIDQGFDITPIKPVQVSLDDYRRLTPLYLKAGVGAPFQSVLDAYFSSTRKTDGKWGVYLNHYGSWGDRKNFNDLKTPAAETFNRVGLFGEHRFGRFGIRGEVGYEYDKVSRYGYDTLLLAAGRPAGSERVPVDASAAALRQNFSTVHGRVVFGHSFEDLSYFNVRFGVGAAYFQDHFDMRQTDLSPFLDLGKRFGGLHEVTLHVGYDYYKGGGDLTSVRYGKENTPEAVPYKDQVLTVSPLYRLRGERAELALGVTYALDNDGYRSEGALFPRFEFRWNPAGGGFVPYLRVDGRYLNNGYRNTAARNPYVYQGVFGKNTAEYNGRVGIRGGISSSFAYHVFGGYSRYRNMNVFANVFGDAGYVLGGNVFDVMNLDASMWTVGGEIEGRISSSFGAELAVQYRWYDTKDRIRYTRGDEQLESPFYFGLPGLTAGVALKYHYKDRFSFKVGADVLGPRDFLDRYAAAETPYVRQHVNMQVDVHLEAEYNISKVIGVFLEGRNLANQKMYYYNQYRALGVNALLGVKLQF